MKKILVILILFTFGIAQEVKSEVESVKIDSVAIVAEMNKMMSEIIAIDADVKELLEYRNKVAFAHNKFANMLVPPKSPKIEEEGEE